MAIAVALYQNHMAKDGSEYAKVLPSESVSFEQLLDDMCTDTSMETADMATVFARLRDRLLHHMSRGHRVETPIGYFTPGIAGGRLVTNGHLASVSKEDLKINFSVSQNLVSSLRLTAEVDVIDYQFVRSPLIKHMVNAATESDETFSAGCLCHMSGNRLAFDRNEETQGVFLIPEADPDNPLRMNVYSRNGSSYVDFLLEGASAGAYMVELRGKSGSSTYDRNITVA